MKTREVKVTIKVSVAKALLDSRDEPYLYTLGYEKEELAKQEVKNGVEAYFDGFELLANHDPSGIGLEEVVNAKLHYTVLVELI